MDHRTGNVVYSQDRSKSLLDVEGVGPLTFLVFQTAGFHRVCDVNQTRLQQHAVREAAESLARDGRLVRPYHQVLASRCNDIIRKIRFPLFGPTVEIPEWTLCSMTYEQLEDPVIAPSGYNYERSIIVRRLQTNQTDPVTQAPLAIDQLITNNALREAIAHFNANLRMF